MLQRQGGCGLGRSRCGARAHRFERCNNGEEQVHNEPLGMPPAHFRVDHLHSDQNRRPTCTRALRSRAARTDWTANPATIAHPYTIANMLVWSSVTMPWTRVVTIPAYRAAAAPEAGAVDSTPIETPPPRPYASDDPACPHAPHASASANTVGHGCDARAAIQPNVLGLAKETAARIAMPKRRRRQIRRSDGACLVARVRRPRRTRPTAARCTKDQSPSIFPNLVPPAAREKAICADRGNRSHDDAFGRHHSPVPRPSRGLNPAERAAAFEQKENM